jgi:hypothetical protein
LKNHADNSSREEVADQVNRRGMAETPDPISAVVRVFPAPSTEQKKPTKRTINKVSMAFLFPEGKIRILGRGGWLPVDIEGQRSERLRALALTLSLEGKGYL